MDLVLERGDEVIAMHVLGGCGILGLGVIFLFQDHGGLRDVEVRSDVLDIDLCSLLR